MGFQCITYHNTGRKKRKLEKKKELEKDKGNAKEKEEVQNLGRFLVEVTSQVFADLEANNLCLTLKAFVLKMGERKQNELDSATSLQRIQRNGNCDIIPDYSGYIIAAFV
ncbi:hypothetical protein L2E82_10903 [Cichorium intybus]|uniref:Uncharacterized protein n=1 Tax=Cichorium intybus TaxID=13427 RepID=A0ACB9GCU2_CICIN|nr:hypothetical protein L2E82_10903 [Cichorium intybus]